MLGISRELIQTLRLQASGDQSFDFWAVAFEGCFFGAETSRPLSALREEIVSLGVVMCVAEMLEQMSLISPCDLYAIRPRHHVVV